MYLFTKRSIFIFQLFVFIVVQSLSAQSLFINEFMASNTAAIADPDYKEYGDWVELYNAGNTQVNLKGYSITDLLSQPKKYIFYDRYYHTAECIYSYLDRRQSHWYSCEFQIKRIR